MNVQAWIAIALILAVVLVVLMALRKGQPKTAETQISHQLPQAPLQLSVVEQCCLQALQQAAGAEHNIRNKVAPTALSINGAEQIQQRLDFVLFGKKSGKPACVIQLRSASGQDEQAIDRALAEAEIPLYRLPRKSSYSFMEMRELLGSHLEMPPPSPDEMLATITMQAFHLCSKCQSQMHLKRASSGPHKGMLFWVCEGYPDSCSGVEIYSE